MTNPGNLSNCLPFLSTAILGLALNGCGMNSMAPSRVLQSMTVSPAIADAAHSPDGKVQFKASGTFSQPPSPDVVTFVAPYSGSWSVSNLDIATISPSGLAQCVPGGSGTVDVIAVASANSAPPGAMSIGVRGMAKLTCP
jgi:hypothetical protein